MTYLRLGDRDVSLLDIGTVAALTLVLRLIVGDPMSWWWVAAMPIWFVLAPWLAELGLLILAAILILALAACHDLGVAVSRLFRRP